MVDTDLRARLDAMRAEMDALEHELRDGPDQAVVARPRRRRARVIAGVLLAIVAVAVPVGVFANHQFTDVATSNTFHGSIDKIKTAGITAGCSATKYCPNDPVTRGQMAAFLTRAATRGGSFSDSNVAINDTDYASVVTGTIKTPGAGFIYLSADAMAYTTDTSGCPCVAAIDIEIDGDYDGSFFYGQTLENAPGGEQRAYAALSDGWVIPVDSAGDHTATVHMYLDYGTAEVFADATMTLLWVPFDESGDAWEEPPITTSQRQPQNR